MNQFHSWDPEQDYFDDDLSLSPKEENSEYRELLDRIEMALNTMELPDPPPGMADEVIDYIEWREKRRLWYLQLPGISALVEVVKTLNRYIRKIQWPMMVQREYLPITLTILAILWSVFLTPRLEPAKMEPYITKANQVADTLLIKGEHFANQVRLMTQEWIDKTQKPSVETNPKKMKESSSNSRTYYKTSMKGMTTT